jgi:hypothetical protein
VSGARGRFVCLRSRCLGAGQLENHSKCSLLGEKMILLNSRPPIGNGRR